MDVDRQRVVAYHEAGHAVVANALGSTVHWIERNADGSGLCNASHLISEADDAVIYLAGGLAEGYKFGPTQTNLSPNDRKGLRNLTPAQRARAIERASEILRAKWADVEALAMQLLEEPDGCVPLPFPRDFSDS